MNGGMLHLYELGEGGNGIVVGFDPPVSSGKEEGIILCIIPGRVMGRSAHFRSEAPHFRGIATHFRSPLVY